MNKSYNIFGIVLTIVAIGVASYVLFRQYPKEPTPLTVAPTTVHYMCASGTIDAAYEGTTVVLTLSDGRVLSLTQSLSASGVRYEKDTTVFVSKGDNSFLQENGVTTYDSCVSNTTAPVVTADGKKIFTDQGKTFRFSYPKELTVSGGELGYTQSWQINTQRLGLMLAKVVIPRETQPKTNFSSATFTVGTSSDTQAIKDCLVADNGEMAKGMTTINGVSYATFVLGDAGAGNYYDTTSYHTLRNSQCYVIEYTIHSTSLGAYSPDQGIKQFDKASITKTMEAIVHSFTFL
jgi:membrane-bound inhibitor of C-type lysozyme